MVTFDLTRKTVVVGAAAALLAIGGFVTGFVSCLDMRSSPSNETIERYLHHAGDAPPEVRAGVLNSLRAFQDGYIKRNSSDLDTFMRDLFPRDEDILILGSQSGSSEWARGYTAAAQFIRRDWRDWGDFRFDVDHSIVWSSGDIAWVASVGHVQSNNAETPLRLTAILTRSGDRWLFRQIQFQLDQTDPIEADVWNPRTFFRAARLALRKMTTQASAMRR